MMRVRPALSEDEPVLLRIDTATWTSVTSPAPPPPPDRPFFHEGTPVEDVLVAEEDRGVLGYVTLGQPIPLPSHAHVLEIAGLAVDPGRQRSGAGRALVDAAVEQARARRARKLSLRVLGHNAAARRLYAACGFVVEGVLRAEFVLDGEDVDDVLMAHHLA